jgi:hypothetical protein
MNSSFYMPPKLILTVILLDSIIAEVYFNYKLLVATSHQYSETNVMHFLISLLRIKGFFMFQALIADPQEVLHLVYCVHVMSVACTTIYQV